MGVGDGVPQAIGSTPWRQTLAQSRVMDVLAGFDPRIAGTLPLGVSVAGSDIDILCHAPDPNAVGEVLWQWPDRPDSLLIRRWTSDTRPLIATFTIADWPVEVFASPVPVDDQAGWRHFVAEKRLLEIAGAPLRDHIVTQRRSGMKTEPAFAKALGLRGDPYIALDALADAKHEHLQALVAAAGFAAF